MLPGDLLRRARTGSLLVRYTVAGVIAVVALLLTAAVEPFMGRPPTAPVFAMILLVAWIVGFGPAVLATFLTVGVLEYMAAPHLHLNPGEGSWLLSFAISALAVAWLASALQRAAEERNTLLEREHAARADAVAANLSKDYFLAMVSHELRTPLTVMLGWVHVLKSGKASPDQAARALDTVERSTLLQARLVDELLDISRIVAGKLPLDKRVMDLGPVVRGAVDSLRREADEKGLLLDDVAQPHIPEIVGDASRLEQVVLNLVTNSIKFTPPGGRITVELSANGACVRLTVVDTGIGIRPELLPHVFESFRQGELTSSRKGLGLGLAIVKHVVELHGGNVSVESSGAGHGTSFIVELPACRSGQPLAT
jgi:signal transduction histidine kinase